MWELLQFGLGGEATARDLSTLRDGRVMPVHLQMGTRKQPKIHQWCGVFRCGWRSWWGNRSRRPLACHLCSDMPALCRLPCLTEGACRYLLASEAWLSLVEQLWGRLISEQELANESAQLSKQLWQHPSSVSTEESVMWDPVLEKDGFAWPRLC